MTDERATGPPPTDSGGSPTEPAAGPSPAGRFRTRLDRATFRRWFGVHLVVAVLFFVAGWAVGHAFHGVLATMAPEEGLAPTAPGSLGLPRLTFTGLLGHNLRAAAISAAGVVTLGLTSVLSLLATGFVAGLVVAAALDVTTVPVVAAYIFPHAVFELPAFFLVAAIAFRVNHRAVRYVLGYDETVITRQELFEAGVLLGGVVVLLALAAWIEVNVTPVVGQYVAGP